MDYQPTPEEIEKKVRKLKIKSEAVKFLTKVEFKKHIREQNERNERKNEKKRMKKEEARKKEEEEDKIRVRINRYAYFIFISCAIFLTWFTFVYHTSLEKSLLEVATLVACMTTFIMIMTFEPFSELHRYLEIMLGKWFQKQKSE